MHLLVVCLGLLGKSRTMDGIVSRFIAVGADDIGHVYLAIGSSLVIGLKRGSEWFWDKFSGPLILLSLETPDLMMAPLSTVVAVAVEPPVRRTVGGIIPLVLSPFFSSSYLLCGHCQVLWVLGLES